MKLIANAAMVYGGKSLTAGDEFEVAQPHARALLAVGKHTKGVKGASEPKAEAPDPESDEDKAKPKKGNYLRRDMKAADK